jgi:hypothetical protein
MKIVPGASIGSSTLSVFIGGVIAGCACQAPILYNLLYFLGLNALEASGLVASVDVYQFEIMWLLILLNLGMIILVLSKIPSTAVVKKQ